MGCVYVQSDQDSSSDKKLGWKRDNANGMYFSFQIASGNFDQKQCKC